MFVVIGVYYIYDVLVGLVDIGDGGVYCDEIVFEGGKYDVWCYFGKG